MTPSIRIQIFQPFVQQPFQLRRHHHLQALAAGLMLAQRFLNNFIRPFVAAGLNQLGHVFFEALGQGDVHGLTIICCQIVSTGNPAFLAIVRAAGGDADETPQETR